MDKDEMIKKPNCNYCSHQECCHMLEVYDDCKEEVEEYGCDQYQAKIADDEIIIKKSEYVVIPKQDWEDRAYIHAMENHLYQKCRDMIGEKFVAKEEVEYWKSRCKEIGDVASKETSREILQAINKYLVGTRGIYTVKTFRNCRFEDIILVRADDLETLVKKLAKEHDIELED